MDIKEAFRRSFVVHPFMEVRDGVKFLYQSEFGGGHLIPDESYALARLREELDAVSYSENAPLCEPLGDKTVRINLAAVKGRISPETLCRIFVLSANKIKGNISSFLEKLTILSDYFDKSEIDAYMEQYAQAGYPVVSHTETYRKLYAPAYRVVGAEYARLLPILMAIDEKKPHLVAIDGRCGSGKTTAAGLLAEIYDCNLFHADDYYLPPEMRRAERRGTPGGNMHRERLYAEVLLPVKETRMVFHRKFDCETCTLGDTIEVPYKDMTIVEGSYSLHPDLAGAYDLRIFLDIEKDEQLARLAIRESPESLEAFKKLWIPMEERYFETFRIRESADIILG